MRVYLMGICGTGMGSLAGLLKKLGHEVTGSDEKIYPPMSDKLRDWHIPVLEGFAAPHLDPAPELVIVGNVIRRDNPEATAMRERNLRHLSMPQAIAELGIGARHSIVIAGTHGKTTTTALAAHVLVHAGRDPGFLVGGALVGYDDSFRVGQPERGFFVVEGDEYDTAYFDKGPKFVHYRPRTSVITSLEFDHADIFADIGAVEGAFAKLIAATASDGRLVIWGGAERALALARAGRGKRALTVYDVAPGPGVDLWLESHQSGPEGLSFTPVLRGRSLGPMRVPLWGDFSAQNVLAVLGALEAAELSPAELAAGFASFAGVRRRMEIVGEVGGVTVVDDFAHHPTAVRVTLDAARTRFPHRRIWAVFEPRSATSRRNVFFAEYCEAFGHADAVVIASHARLGEIPEAERFSPEKLAAALRAAGTSAWAEATVESIAALLVREVHPGDVVMLLSNGDFGGLRRLFLERLRAAAG